MLHGQWLVGRIVGLWCGIFGWKWVARWHDESPRFWFGKPGHDDASCRRRRCDVPWWLVRRHGLDVDRRSDSSAVIRWHWFVGEFDVSLIFQIVATCRELIRGGGRGASAVFCRLRRASNPRERSGEPTRRRLTPAIFSMSRSGYLHPTLHFLSTD